VTRMAPGSAAQGAQAIRLTHVVELLRRVVPDQYLRRIVEFERTGHIDAPCHRAVCFSGKDKLLPCTKNDYNFKNRKNATV